MGDFFLGSKLVLYSAKISFIKAIMNCPGSLTGWNFQHETNADCFAVDETMLELCNERC
jgi:hypothetical protein